MSAVTEKRCLFTGAVVLMSLLVNLPGKEASVDWTIKKNSSGIAVVEAVVDIIQQSCLFPDDRLMLRRIAWAETYDGQAARTFSVPDFYGGIWQIDKTSFTQTKSIANETVYSEINSKLNIDWKSVHYTDLVKPLYSGLAARLKIALYFSTTNIPQDVQTQANYWAQHYTNINNWGNVTNAVEVYNKASDRTATRCSSPKADVIFVLDSSGSIGSSNFDNVRQFAVNVIQSFVIGRKNVRVSLIQFSDVARTEFNLTAYTTTTQLVNVASSIPYISSGTNTVAGLQALQSTVQSEARFDDGVPVVAILMTDGQSNDRTATLAEAAKVHQTLANKMTVYSIGVGSGVDFTELNAIASSPSCQYVFHLTSFNDITAFSYQIMKKACKEPAPVTEQKVVTATVLKGEMTYFSATARRKKRGIEVTVKPRVGSRVKVYLSWSVKNPNAAKHDYSYELDGSNADQSTQVIPWPKDNNVPKRRRRDVDNNNNNDTDEAASEGPMLTLYGAIEGIGDQEGGNSFDLSYVVTDRVVVTDAPLEAAAASAAGTMSAIVLAISMVVSRRNYDATT